MAAEIHPYVDSNMAIVTKVAPPRPSSTDAASASGRSLILAPIVRATMQAKSCEWTGD
jgi:hypothetical protein